MRFIQCDGFENVNDETLGRPRAHVPHTSTHIARFGGSRDGACQSIKREETVVASASDSAMSDEDSCERCECCGVRIYRCQHDAGERFPRCTEMLRAAEAGNIRRVRRLHEHGCPWDEATCTSAAEGGHLECLKYLHENGCPWNEETCKYAAKCLQLECLKYAYEHGCPWNVENELLPDVKTALDILQLEMRETIPNGTYEIARENLQALHDDHSGDIPRDAGLDVFQRIADLRDVSRRCALVSNTMTALDEVRETISNGSYVQMSACLKRIHDLIVVYDSSDEDDDFSDEDDE